MNNKEKYRKGFEEVFPPEEGIEWCGDESDYVVAFKAKPSMISLLPLMQYRSLFCGWCAAKQQSEWISVDDRLPETKYEIEEFESDGENCFFHGFASQSIEISDGHNLARGHYRDDGTWCIYDAQHDFQLVDQADITHWKALPEPPTNTQGDV